VRLTILFLFGLTSLLYAQPPQYLQSIWQRWDASDLVCTGTASKPVRTGIARTIDGSSRDELASEVTFETCFKGNTPASSPVRVVGYSVYALNDVRNGMGIAYSGPPTGFVRKGRNLFFLRKSTSAGVWEVAVPIYETAIRLADSRPRYPGNSSPNFFRDALTIEFEAAIVQFESTDVSDIERIFDLLGSSRGVDELATFSKTVPLPIQSEIAVALVEHDQLEFEPLAISLLADTRAPIWKRANAASALGRHGTERALPYLRQIASQAATTDDLKSLHVWVAEACQRLETRISEQRPAH
jgi:hypothetical protein